jgi:hypothetical protein
MDRFFYAAIAFQEGVRNNDAQLRQSARGQMQLLRATMGKTNYLVLSIFQTAERFLLPRDIREYIERTELANQTGLEEKNVGMDELGEMHNKMLKRWCVSSDSNKHWDQGQALLYHSKDHSAVLRKEMGIRTFAPRVRSLLEWDEDIASCRKAWSVENFLTPRERALTDLSGQQLPPHLPELLSEGRSIIKRYWKEKFQEADGTKDFFSFSCSTTAADFIKGTKKRKKSEPDIDTESELSLEEKEWWQSFTGAELTVVLKEKKATNKQIFNHIKISGGKKVVLRRVLHYFPKALGEALQEKDQATNKNKKRKTVATGVITGLIKD